MPEPLHPLTLSEVLDRTAQFYRRRFFVYFGIASIPVGILLVFAALVFLLLAWTGLWSDNSPDLNAAGVAAIILVIVLGLIALPIWVGATALGWAAASHAAARDFLGEPISIRSAYRAVWSRGWRYVGLYLLLGLIVVVAPSVVAVIGAVVLALVAAAGGNGSALAALATFGIFALMLTVGGVALWLLLRLGMAFPAAVVEHASPWAAIKRANALSRGTRGRIFLLFLLGMALSWILTLGAMVPVLIVITLIPAANAPQHSELVGRIFLFAWYGLSFAVQAVVRPVYGIAITLFYFDQRMRTEGFDIEWQMRQAGLVAPPAPAPEPEPAAQPWLAPIAPAQAPQALPVPAPPTLPATPPLPPGEGAL